MENLENKNRILANSNIGLWRVEIGEDSLPRLYVDEEMMNLIGATDEMTPEEMYRQWFEGVHPDYLDAVNNFMEKICEGYRTEVQYYWKHPSKGMLYVRCGGMRDQSYTEGIRVEGNHQNVSGMVHLQKDWLTGLYTKEYFYRKAEEIINKNPDQEYRILVSDVENFKMVNEKYGTETGDIVLKYLASAMRRYVPNYILGGRITADVFVVLQDAVEESREEGTELANKILKECPVQNLVWKHGIYYTKFDRTISAQAMTDRARLALQSIKGVYDVHCAVYDDKFRTNLLNQQTILENMEEALNRKQFQVYLQSKNNPTTDEPVGAEALVRWQHPELGFMNPADFVPLFEKNGFISKLDEYVFVEVCRILCNWKNNNKPMIPISVNFSRRDFENERLAEILRDCVDGHGLPRDMVHIEITESLFSDNPEKISAIIRKLHEYGFVIELDDFGTGYSSLTTLTELDLDVLKLDMSIIRKDDPNSEKNLLDFCTQLAKLMRLRTVAEGVETDDQLKRINQVGIDYVQGYYYTKPLPVQEFEQYLQEQQEAER